MRILAHSFLFRIKIFYGQLRLYAGTIISRAGEPDIIVVLC